MNKITLLSAGIFDFNIWNMLIYLANFVILFVALYLLLFKPVKKFMNKRREGLEKVSEENKKLSEEVESMKAEYDHLIADAKQGLAKANEQAKAVAEKRSQEIVEEANRQARSIMTKAKAEIESEKVRAENEIKGQVAELSIEVARKIIGKNIDAKTNSKLIEESLEKWSHEQN